MLDLRLSYRPWLPRVCVVWVRSGLAGQLQVFASATGGLVRPQDSARSTISRPSLVCSQGSGRPRTGPGRLGWGCGAGWPVTTGRKRLSAPKLVRILGARGDLATVSATTAGPGTAGVPAVRPGSAAGSGPSGGGRAGRGHRRPPATPPPGEGKRISHADLRTALSRLRP